MNPDKLFYYLDGKLPAAEREKFEDELLRDPQLQKEFAIARKIHERMSGPEREVILDEPPGAARSRQMVRRIMIVFLALIFINTVIGIVVIGMLESKKRQATRESEKSRQDVALALQKAAANALPAPSLVDEIKVTVAAGQQDGMINKIGDAAKQAGGSAAKNLTNENGTLVFAEVPVDRVKQFRDALVQLGAVLPTSSAPDPTSGNAILQIRVAPRAE